MSQVSLQMQEIMAKAIQMNNREQAKQVTQTKKLTKATQVYETQSRKLLASLSQTKGITVGMVFDMDMLGGAFLRIKNAISFLFSGPLVEGFWSGEFFKKAADGVRNFIQTRKEEKAATDKTIAATKPLTKALAGGLPSPERKMAQAFGFGPTAPEQFIGTKEKPLEPPPKEAGKFVKGMQKLGKPAKIFNKNVMKPLSKIAGAGLGLGFQSQIILGVLQAFSNLFNVFQPVFDVVGMLVEMIGTGFQPIITEMLETLTSPDTMSLINMLTQAVLEFSEALAPLFPIIIQLIVVAIIPLAAVFRILAAVIVPFTPLIMMAADAISFLTGLVMLIVEPVEAFAGWISETLQPMEFLNDALNNFFDWINDIADLVDTLSGGKVQTSTGITNIFGGLADVFGLAGGGIVKPPGGLFRVGEGRKPEVVSPLSDLKTMIRDTMEETGRGSGAITINVNGVAPGADIDELARLVGRKIGLWV